MARTPEGTALTALHRQRQVALRSAIALEVARVFPLWDLKDEATYAGLQAALAAIVTRGAGVASQQAADYYQAFRAAEIPEASPLAQIALVAGPDMAQIAVSLRATSKATVYSALAAGTPYQDAMASALVQTSGSMSRLALQPGRETITNAVDIDTRALGWVRTTSGRPCAFCAMLASRGPVYKSETVRFRSHDHCTCGAEPVYPGAEWPEQSVQYREIWDRTRSLPEFRRALAQARLVISEQVTPDVVEVLTGAVAREVKERVQTVLDHSVVRVMDLSARTKSPFRLRQQYYRPRNGPEQTIGVIADLNITLDEANAVAAHALQIADWDPIVSREMTGFEWGAARARAGLVRNLNYTRWRDNLAAEFGDANAGDLVALYLADAEALARSAPEVFQKVHALMGEAQERFASALTMRLDLLEKRLAKELAAESDTIAAAAEVAAMDKTAGGLVAQVAAIGDDKARLIAFARSLTSAGRIADSGMKTVAADKLREIIAAIAEEMDLREFKLREIMTARGNALARGGHGHLSFKWSSMRQRSIRRSADEMAQAAPARIAQTVEQYQAHVDEWTKKLAQEMTRVRQQLERAGQAAAGMTDDEALELARRLVAAAPARTSFYDMPPADMPWLPNITRALGDYDHRAEVLARHRFNLQKALDDAAKGAGGADVFAKTGDAVIDGVAYQMPGGAEAWQCLLTPIPGHEGSASWGVVVHEVGHNRWYEALSQADRDAYSALYRADEAAGRLISPSDYGIREANKHTWQPGTEHFAECYQTYRAYMVTGDARYLQLIPDWALDFMRRVI